jgi:hypothetical protein
VLPMVLPQSPRERREAKALAVVKAIRREPEVPVIVPYIPPTPDPTYTFWGQPNDTPLPDCIVYFMYSAGRIKIGLSTGLRGRHNGLKKAGPFPPVVLLIVAGGREVEQEFHDKFSEDRLHGEWFTLSHRLRNFLRLRLCDVGLASMDQAEAEFRAYCLAVVESYKPAPKRKPPKHCAHGKRLHHPCAICDRDRDLKILAELKERE